MQADKTHRSRRKAAAKKTYSVPVLVPWGTLRAMTQKVGRAGHSDGGSTKNKTKTR